MILVQEKQYEKILEKLNEIPFNTLFARAVLESKVPGRVFVDNIHDSKSFYIAHSYGMSLLFGDSENDDFNASLSDFILNINCHRLKQEWLQVYPEKWNEKLKEILDYKILDYSKTEKKYTQTEIDMIIEKSKKSQVIQWRRVNFKYKVLNKTIGAQTEYNIKLIDSDTYDRIEGSVIPSNFWNSKELFLSKGIGYVLMKGNDIVSIAFSSCISENQLEIGVETSKDYRGMGFTKYVCEAMLNYCKANKYMPIWACRKENIGSYKLAKSLGFEECATIPYYELII